MSNEAIFPGPGQIPPEMSQTDPGQPYGALYPANPDDSGAEVRPLSVYTVAAIAVFVSLVISIAALAGYHGFFANKQRIGIVDITGILETSELIFTEKLSALSGDKVTDADRESAYDLVRDTGNKLDAALTQIQNTCNCVLMTKAAVIGNGAIDFTPQVKAALGIDKVDVQALQERVRNAIAIKSPGTKNKPK